MKMRVRSGVAMLVLMLAGTGWAKESPHIGYVFPAGGQRGQTFEVTVGGQFLSSANAVVVTGDGVTATVKTYREILSLRDIRQRQRQIKILDAKIPNASEEQKARLEKQIARMEAVLAMQDAERLRRKIAPELQVREDKSQFNPQLSERLVLEVLIAADAPDGERALRIQTDDGVSNPIFFHVGNLAELREAEPNDDHMAVDLQQIKLPVLINGQIMPGDIDHFSFKARRGEQLVVDVSARKLIPYLADAVPGWFQATLALFDEEGREVAFADDYKFNPDPVLFHKVLKTGQYTLQIRDSIYRGREDFVYRISIGRLPFITSIFPLGWKKDGEVEINLRGKNLPKTTISGQLTARDVMVKQVSVKRGEIRSNPVPFVVGNLPEILEAEPNEKAADCQRVQLPVVVNGQIMHPGDRDLFRFEGRAGQQVALEVHARRLNSPLDSVVRLYDSAWKELASNDDFVDRASGLTTHHADSYLFQTLPANGIYYVVLADTQQHGSAEHAYRLRIAEARPDFALRLEPSGVNIAPGGSATFTAHAMRKDGFDGKIELRADELPRGFSMSRAVIPAGADRVRFTLTASDDFSASEVHPHLVGTASIGKRRITREVKAVDDQMQAFLYRHLVPAAELILVPAAANRFAFKANLPRSGVIRLPLNEEVVIPIDVDGDKRYFKSVKFMLDNPPKGISLIKGRVKNGRDRAEVLIKATSPLALGFEDNLILKAELKRGRSSTFCLSPAIPIRVVRGKPVHE